MKKLALLVLFLSCTVPGIGQLVLAIAPNGTVNAPIDVNGWQHFKLTLTQNVTFNFVIVPPIPAPAQSTLRVIFTQDATGGRTVAFASNITSPCAINALANATTVCSFTFDNTTSTWQGAGSGSGPVAKADLTGQQANVGFVNIYTVPASGIGTYRFSAYLVITQAATTSSALPMPSVSWTDNDSGVATNAQFGLSPTGNTVGINNSQGQSTTSVVFNAKTGTQIGYQTTGYASVGAIPMQYAIHVKLEFLGP